MGRIMSIAIYLRGQRCLPRGRPPSARRSPQCTARGEPAEWYDEGESHGRRPALARLVSDLEAGGLATVIVSDMIRLMRPPELLYGLAERAQCGALLHGVHGGDIDLATKDGRSTAAMFDASMALHGAERDAEARITRARRAARAGGAS